MSRTPSFSPAARAVAVLALVVAALAAGFAAADDRELLRRADEPYVFVVFDTSGSMNWSPACTQGDTFDDVDPFDSRCTRICDLGDAMCEKLCPDVGCSEYATEEVVELEEIFVDNQDPAPAVTFTGPWSTFSDPDAYGPGNSYHFFPGSNRTLQSFTFDPTITNDGTYQLYMSWVTRTTRASNVLVDVTHNGGVSTVAVDQSRDAQVETCSPDDLDCTEYDPGIWNLLGTFDLSSADATSGTVKIRTEGKYSETEEDATLVADAIRWVRIDVPGCVGDQVYRCEQDICHTGDCYVPLNADDPNSKFFQAKQALYKVAESPRIKENVQFGFGSYNQDDLRIPMKHWLYRVSDVRIDPVSSLEVPQTAADLPGIGTDGDNDGHGDVEFPQIGSTEIFGNYSRAPGTLSSIDNDRAPPRDSGDGWDCRAVNNGRDADQNRPEYQSHFVGCVGVNPNDSSDPIRAADYLSDPWETERARRIPKLGRNGEWETAVWYRVDHDNNQIYKVVYKPHSSAPDFGDDLFPVDIEVIPCADGLNANCVPGDAYTGTVYYELVSQFLANDSSLKRQPMREAGFFHRQKTIIHEDDPACSGLEPNDDTNYASSSFPQDDPPPPADDLAHLSGLSREDDWWRGYVTKWRTVEDPRGTTLSSDPTDPSVRLDLFDVGDFIPLDWEDTNHDTMLARLAPNMASNPSAAPDFRSGVYFDNEFVQDSEHGPTQYNNPDVRRLRLTLDGDDFDGNLTVADTPGEPIERPLVALGLTPLAESLADFKDWYGGVGGSQGWKDFAETEDTGFICRQKFVLMLTDGVDTCFGQCKDADQDPCNSGTWPNDPCVVPGTLLTDHDIRTYLVGFGIEDGSSLTCMAVAGGTDEPLLPRNQEELIEALSDILSSIVAEERTFASASVPAIQSTTADKIFLSGFIPLDDRSIWPGRVDAFRKPLPLTVDKEPDTDRKCVPIDTAEDSLQAACHLWEVGEKLLEQAPAAEDIVTAADLKIGDGFDTERRVIYPLENEDGERPTPLRLFDVPILRDASSVPTEDALDMGAVLLDDSVVQDFEAGTLPDADVEAEFLRVIGETLEIKTSEEAGDYVLGDIFHASPVVVSGPSNFTYFATDLCGAIQSASTPNNCVAGEDRGYRDFALRHTWRRRMMVVAANDGQLHFVDAGVRQLVDDFAGTGKVELFNDGSGHELFSYMPRLVMPVVKEIADSATAAEPPHIFSVDGPMSVADVFIDPSDLGGGVTVADRTWRTVLMGGLREGGFSSTAGAVVPNFKSGYYALDITAPDVINERSTADPDPTWIPCPATNPGCDEDDVPPAEFLPSCLLFDYSGDGHQSTPPACDEPFPSELWSFTDAVRIEESEITGDTNDTDILTFYLDEDENGLFDLGDTWSRPVIGQVAVCEEAGIECDPDSPSVNAGEDLVTYHVAIFGGGMDPERKGAAQVEGNYLYMVDVETGRIIYKRELEGSAAGDPAALDVDRDGILDVVYIGTTDGILYKVDLKERTSAGRVPGFDSSFTIDQDQLVTLSSMGSAVPFSMTYTGGETVTLDSTHGVRRITDDAWKPFPILDTQGVPIYFAPAAFLIAERNQYGLALGLGDREDITSTHSEIPDARRERFFVIVDQDFEPADFTPATDPTDPGFNSSTPCKDQLPIVTGCIEQISLTDDPDFNADYLLAPEPFPNGSSSVPCDPATQDCLRPGWTLTFPDVDDPATPQDEDLHRSRVTNEAFVVAGVLVFSAFQPVDPDAPPDPDDPCRPPQGDTRAFVVSVRNAAPLANLDPSNDDSSSPDVLKAGDRFHLIDELTTAPFVETEATKNPNVEGDTILDEIDTQTANQVRDALMAQFPRGSRFNDAYKVVIAALRNSTGVNVYATIPIAIYPADWRDQ